MPQSFGNEFSSICNYCGVVAAWSRKTLKKLEFFAFFGKDPLGENFQNSVRKDPSPQRSTSGSNFVKFGRREIGKVVRYLPDKNKPNFASLSRSRYCIDRAQIYRGQPQTIYSKCSRLCPNRFTFGGVTSERVNTVRARFKANPIFGWSLSNYLLTILLSSLNIRY